MMCFSIFSFHVSTSIDTKKSDFIFINCKLPNYHIISIITHMWVSAAKALIKTQLHASGELQLLYIDMRVLDII